MAKEETGSPTTSNAQKLWESLLRSVDAELGKIYSQKAASVALETQALHDFMKSERKLFTRAVELNGPLPYHQLPNWDTILDVNVKDGVFYSTIFQALGEWNKETTRDRLKSTAQIQLLRNAFERSYHNRNSKPSSEEELINWVAATVVDLRASISTALQLKLLTDEEYGLNTVIFAADLRTSHWNYFDKPDGDEEEEKPTGIWPEHFEPAIRRLLGQGEAENPDIHRNTVFVINHLKSTASAYDLSEETVARTWLQSSILGIKLEKWLPSECSQELIAKLEKVISGLYPKPDESSFYDNFKGVLRQNIYEPSAGLRPSSLGGVKVVMDQWFSQEERSIREEHKEELEASVAQAIEQGIDQSFDRLLVQGSEGALLAATNDYCSITRITNRLTSLLNTLQDDFEVDISSNKTSSLTAAQGITSAAVSYRQYADSLLELQDVFAGEVVQNTPDYEKVKTYIEGDAKDRIDSVQDIASLIYLGIDRPEPRIKVAEMKGVQLAAQAAGLQQTYFKNLPENRLVAVIAALEELKNSTLVDFETKLKAFNGDIAEYIEALTTYGAKKRVFEKDYESVGIIEQALENLTQITTDYAN